MVRCIYCSEKTILYVNGQPVCMDCAKLIGAGKHPLFNQHAVRGSSSPLKVKSAGQ